jgi:deoxyribodipyrimidine photo-lyase
LANLKKSLEQVGSGLIIRQGNTLAELLDIIKLSDAKYIYINSLYEPASRKRDDHITSSLRKIGITLRGFNGSLLSDPASILNQTGTPYLVYGAYRRRVLAETFPKPIRVSSELPPLPASAEILKSLPISTLHLKPKIPWDENIKKNWLVGEEEAQRKLRQFCRDAVKSYEVSREVPSIPGTSRLSPHLHFGEVSPRQIWFSVSQLTSDSTPYLKQILWREFSYYLLYHHPHLATQPLRAEFQDFPWEGTTQHLKAWQQGMTGYPMVDAGMRELWQTGWMHNRVRMIVASFLVKHLRIHWLQGARWFWDTLVDADLANNTQGWQWTSGCGADASPFFRVFNPVLQGKKFDPQGHYIRKWIPEISSLPDKWIHTPWESRVALDYPSPIVNHDEARFSALKAFDDMRRKYRSGR